MNLTHLSTEKQTNIFFTTNTKDTIYPAGIQWEGSNGTNTPKPVTAK